MDEEQIVKRVTRNVCKGLMDALNNLVIRLEDGSVRLNVDDSTQTESIKLSLPTTITAVTGVLPGAALGHHPSTIPVIIPQPLHRRPPSKRKKRKRRVDESSRSGSSAIKPTGTVSDTSASGSRSLAVSSAEVTDANHADIDRFEKSGYWRYDRDDLLTFSQLPLSKTKPLCGAKLGNFDREFVGRMSKNSSIILDTVSDSSLDVHFFIINPI